MSFASLGLPAPLLNAVTEMGYKTPSEIQEKTIPVIRTRRDIMATAETGTGKTASFMLPILEHLADGERVRPNHARTLILAPTRELAAQVGNSAAKYGKYLSLSSAVVYGGVKINPQLMRMRKGVDILVATPGRLLDLFNRNAIKFSQIETLVLDEADRMLDMGFIHDIRKIIQLLPKKKQSLMFSATFSREIRDLAKGLVHNPVEIAVGTNNTTATTVKQWVCPVDKKRKPELLFNLITDRQWNQVLVFTRTKHGADRLADTLNKSGLKTTAIHGNKTQAARSKALLAFKRGKVQILVATDIAARGLDIQSLPQVVNFELPQVPEDYVHRIGRTGRAGQTGEAISLVSADEVRQLFGIERLIKKSLPRTIIDDFEPRHDLPSTPSGRDSKRGNGGRGGYGNARGNSNGGGHARRRSSDGDARRSSSRDGDARRSSSRDGDARRSSSRDGDARRSSSRDGDARRSSSRDGDTRRSSSRDGDARRSSSRDGDARRSSSRDGDARRSSSRDGRSNSEARHGNSNGNSARRSSSNGEARHGNSNGEARHGNSNGNSARRSSSNGEARHGNSNGNSARRSSSNGQARHGNSNGNSARRSSSNGQAQHGNSNGNSARRSSSNGQAQHGNSNSNSARRSSSNGQARHGNSNGNSARSGNSTQERRSDNAQRRHSSKPRQATKSRSGSNSGGNRRWGGDAR